jgi:2,4-dienoyl-CoA reductase-like NADH-dependent reductase (Old Yellow Enzyme family)
MDHLFSALTMRGVTLPNRIVVSPMCQYSSEDGFANDWHLVHLGSRAVGGPGLILSEATAVVPEGRISPKDLGIWKDEHIAFLRRITGFIRAQGCLAGIQLAHAGRKASTTVPWEGNRYVSAGEGGWENVMAPSAIPFNEHYGKAVEMTPFQISQLPEAFGQAAIRSVEAGFEVIEIHAAHGYLLHEFLSPLSNHRQDQYGGSFENRTRLVKQVVQRVRAVIPDHLPLWVRLSATDWVDGQASWNLEESIRLAGELKSLGVDLVDCSSGGLVPQQRIPVGPGYQTPFAAQIRQQAGVLTGAVGLINSPEQADHIIRTQQADVVLLAREFLRDPYFPLRAARHLKQSSRWPVQYERARN